MFVHKYPKGPCVWLSWTPNSGARGKEKSNTAQGEKLHVLEEEGESFPTDVIIYPMPLKCPEW